MIPVIKKVVKWFTGNNKVVAVSLALILSAIIFFLHTKINRLNTELDRAITNVRAYEDIVANKEAARRVLSLTVEELRQSNDSLLVEAKSAANSLKMRDKDLTLVSVIKTVVRDTVETVILPELKDFNERIEFNPLTILTISRLDSILTAKIDITNELVILVEEKREYRTKYKNGLVRFFHFDWHKINNNRYEVYNSNRLVRVTDTRIVNITK